MDENRTQTSKVLSKKKYFHIIEQNGLVKILSFQKIMNPKILFKEH